MGDTTTKQEQVTDADWNTIRMALECVDFDSTPYEQEVTALYEKLQRMGLI